jgi:uncharacterized protein YbaR (Trm112 family)
LIEEEGEPEDADEDNSVFSISENIKMMLLDEDAKEEEKEEER